MSTKSNPASEESIGQVIQEAAEKAGVSADTIKSWCVIKFLEEVVGNEPDLSGDNDFQPQDSHQ